MMEIKQANSIDDVIFLFEEIIETSKIEQSTFGYFAVLYQKVTIHVKEGIVNGRFKDPLRIEKLDVIFANRYLEAYYTYKSNKKPSKSWNVAFKNSKNNSLLVLQHLLLGMNAHINLDLGIATAVVSKNADLEEVKEDFYEINNVLSSLVNEVENSLSKVWPKLTLILKI